MKNQLLIAVIALSVGACTATKDQSAETYGRIERTDEAINALIDKDAKIELLGEGYTWSEGPLWIESKKLLLFTDVPNNVIHKWTEEKGVEVFLTPSGYTGTTPTVSREPGANGLTLDPQGNLIICQHGDRRVSRYDGGFEKPEPKFTTLADRYEGKRLNSPNDVVVRSNGDIFFTDPPYGFKQLDSDPDKELSHNGVYKVSADGKVTLLVDSLTKPNGIALTPDEKTLIVANSDPQKAIWYAFDLDDNDSITNARVFYDATTLVNDENKGLPDGLKIDKNGNVFASGPGGIWIFDKSGKVLGKVRLPNATANCELSDDGKTLFMTSNMNLLRLKMTK
ncbi:MAG TPA: SMP-30/gluconolactonase/LRE family protein [Chryseosolibacter sp.]